MSFNDFDVEFGDEEDNYDDNDNDTVTQKRLIICLRQPNTEH